MNLIQHSKLREMDESHLEIILTWRNQDFVRKVMYHDEIIPLEDHRQWFQRTLNDKAKVVKILYFDHVPLGLVQFHSDEKNRRCEWGFYIGEEKRPKGMGKVLGLLGLDFAFNNLGVRKVCGEVLSHNPKSIQFHQAMGFQIEGKLKEHLEKNGEYLDIYLFALFSDQWKVHRGKIVNQIEGMIL